jgi:hypothetical protein
MHFQDDDWVKLAMLTWDSVSRIRARDVEDRDNDLVRQVKSEADFLTEVTAGPRVLSEVTRTFDEVLQASGDRVIERYGQRQTGWLADIGAYEAPWSNSGYSLAPRNLTWVYCGSHGTKIAQVLQHQLAGRGLGLIKGPWLGMHPKLASIYLATLADAMARHNMVSPVTDDPRMHHAAGALDRLADLLLDDEDPAPARQDPADAYLHVALDAVITPERLADVPIAKLIRFREGHAAELTAFRAHIACLAGELRDIAAVENLDIAHAHLESLYRKNTKPQLDDLRSALRGLGVESSAGTLGLKIDLNAAAGTVVGGIAAAGGQLAVAGAAITMTVVPYLAGKYKARKKAITTSPVAYLLAVDRKLPR